MRTLLILFTGSLVVALSLTVVRVVLKMTSPPGPVSWSIPCAPTHGGADGSPVRAWVCESDVISCFLFADPGFASMCFINDPSKEF